MLGVPMWLRLLLAKGRSHAPCVETIRKVASRFDADKLIYIDIEEWDVAGGVRKEASCA